MMLGRLRRKIGDYLWLATLKRYRSRMGWRQAPKYQRYLDKAKSSNVRGTDDLEMAQAAEHFLSQGWASFADSTNTKMATELLSKIKNDETAEDGVWGEDGRYLRGDIFSKFEEVEKFFHGRVGEFLRAVYGTDFKIFYGITYKSEHKPSGPVGSQLWHADGGPGTCINLMWCLGPVSADNGAMECLSWKDSLDIFKGERTAVPPKPEIYKDRKAYRNAIADYYRKTISNLPPERVNQPTGESGLVFAFRNNVLHKGGFPQLGHDRYVCVFHIYPSVAPTPFHRYKVSGVGKPSSYPENPAFYDKERSTPKVKEAP